MDTADPISVAYANACHKAEATWQEFSDAGPTVPLPYHPTALAYCVGSPFDPPANLHPLLDELRIAAQRDSQLQLVSRLHFSFLALTPHAWDSLADMPALPALTHIIHKHLDAADFTLTHLRLVPAGNTLLLAGLPSPASQVTRNAFIADLLKDPEIAAQLKARWPAHFPPLFWHSTLARCTTARFPQPLRDFYFAHRDTDFGTIHLPTPTLVAVSFDWSRLYNISSPLPAGVETT